MMLDALLFAAIAGGGPYAAMSASQNGATDAAKTREAPRDYEAEQLPIIVTGKPAGSAKIVFAGSRTGRRSLHADGQAATSTSLNGLIAGSGMDPTSTFTRTVSRTECRADEDGIGETAACLLHAAANDFAVGHRDTAITLLRHLATDAQFSLTERHAAARALHAEAESSNDDALRLHAIGLSLNTGQLVPADAQSARRTIVAIALRLGWKDRALQELELLTALPSATPNDLANLAILQRAQDPLLAFDTMRRAIAMSEASGSTVPAGWRTFVNAGTPPQ